MESVRLAIYMCVLKGGGGQMGRRGRGKELRRRCCHDAVVCQPHPTSLFLLFFCVFEQVPAGAGSAAPGAGAAGATPSRPRVNGEMLGSFVGAEVSLVGRVEQVDGTNATLQAAVRWPCMFVCGCA